jgi:hypothetical protein
MKTDAQLATMEIAHYGNILSAARSFFIANAAARGTANAAAGAAKIFASLGPFGFPVVARWSRCSPRSA